MKKIGSHVMILFAAAILMITAVIPVSASSQQSIYEHTNYVYLDKDTKKYPYSSFPYSLTSTKQIKNLKISNKDVTTVKVRRTSKKKDGEVADYYKIAVETFFMGEGKSTVSYTYTEKGGKKRKVIDHYIIKKYSNPVKSLKIGKKEYQKKFNNTTHFKIKKKNIRNKKIKVQLNKGWKLEKITRATSDFKFTNYKNGAKIPFNKKDVLQIWFHRKNNKQDHQLLYIQIR